VRWAAAAVGVIAYDMRDATKLLQQKDPGLMGDKLALGPAMQRLSPKQRAFVLSMAADPFGSAGDWARASGYSDVKDGARVRGCENLHSEAVQAAVFEVAKQLLWGVGPLLSARGLLDLASNPKGKGYQRAVEMLANRVGLHEVEEVVVHKTDETGEALVTRLKALSLKMGLDYDRLLQGTNPKLIEHEAALVTIGADQPLSTADVERLEDEAKQAELVRRAGD
jgi:hypothetical protein